MRWLLSAMLAAICFFSSGVFLSPDASAASPLCPPRLPVMNSWENTTFPSGVSEIYDAIGGSKQINYGFGPSQLEGEPSFTYMGTTYAHFHLGIDTNHIYETIRAPYSGYAYQYVGGSWGTGPGGPNQVIVLKLSNGARMIFMHLSEMIASGKVSAGDVLGVTGNTGYSTGPHLHVEVRDAQGNVVPPEWWRCTLGSVDGSSGREPGAGDYEYQGDSNISVTNSGVTYNFPVNSGTTGMGVRYTSVGSSGSLTLQINQAPGNYYYTGLVAAYNPQDKSGCYIAAFGSSAGLVAIYNYGGSPGGSQYRTISTGSTIRVDWSGGTCTFYVNGSQVGTATYQGDRPYAGYVWKSNYNNTSAFSVVQGASTFSGANAGTVTDDTGTGPQLEDPGGFGFSLFAPFKWMWDKLKGVLVPSEDQLDDLRAELDSFMSREPMGTIKDLVVFSTSVKDGVASVDDSSASGFAGSISVSGCDGWGCAWFSVADVMDALASFLDSLASWLDAVSIGPVSLLGVIQVVNSFGIFWFVVRYIRARVIVAV